MSISIVIRLSQFPIVQVCLTLKKQNPDATFTCIDGSGKKERVSCSIDGKTSEASGKTSKLLKWATSDACSGLKLKFVLNIIFKYFSGGQTSQCKNIQTLEQANSQATFECING
jgi:hypothetical protein